jgi:hypothetical protein
MFDISNHISNLINLLITDTAQYIIKLILLPLFSFILVYLTYVIWLNIAKVKQPFILHSKYVFLKSIIIATILINIYWFFVIRYNGLFLFTWSKFKWEITNIYFMLLPLILAYSILAIMFIRTKFKIKNILN